jgi:hypothetical protein
MQMAFVPLFRTIMHQMQSSQSVFSFEKSGGRRYRQCFLLDKSCWKMYTIFSAVLRQQRKSDVMMSFGLRSQRHLLESRVPIEMYLGWPLSLACKLLWNALHSECVTCVRSVYEDDKNREVRRSFKNIENIWPIRPIDVVSYMRYSINCSGGPLTRLIIVW